MNGMGSRRLRLAALALVLCAAPAALPSLFGGPAEAATAGLSFGPGQPADPQRDQGEPNIEIDANGNIYTCGPTGFTTGADYAQVSTDGGDQFHLLGTPPRGQLADRGGGDCYLATAKEPLDNGAYTLAYVGLADTDFVTARSDDNGASFGATPTTCSGATDRQWTTFIDAETAFVAYNDIARGPLVVQKSTDGGLTYMGYGACSAGAQKDIASNAAFPGPMKADTDGTHNATHPGDPLVYLGYNGNNTVSLAISSDKGDTWQQCLVAETDNDPTNGFVVVDHDNAGNLYVSWGEKGAAAGDFHAMLSWLPVGKIKNCSVADKNPGWSTPVRVDKPPTRTLVFPWLVASGDPGRVAVTWYGSTTAGVADSADFKGPWDVYVAQTLDARAATPSFTQVKATTHPMHYDQVCLSGLACATGGDRSLADFFAMALDPTTGRLVVVYDESGKVPDGVSGPVALPHVLVQETGPRNDGGTLTARRPVVRTGGPDPAGDAESPYSISSLVAAEPPPVAAARDNQKALDITSVDIGPEIDPSTGDAVPDGGFTMTMKVADLSNAALQSALTATDGVSLIWAFRWVNGYRQASVSVHWDPARNAFAGGFDDFATGSVTCASVPSVNGVEPKCMAYPGTASVPLEVNQDAGTITISVPRNLLRELKGTDDDGRPVAVAATRPGTSRFYSGTAFAMSNVLVEAESFLYPVDGTAAFDFVLPGKAARGTGGGGGSGGGGAGGGNGGGSGGGGTTPATGGLGWPVAAVAAGAGAVLAIRLRRRGRVQPPIVL
jgi:uncharacterized membrane protein YgcG